MKLLYIHLLASNPSLLPQSILADKAGGDEFHLCQFCVVCTGHVSDSIQDEICGK